jgi:hypothetical protein
LNRNWSDYPRVSMIDDSSLLVATPTIIGAQNCILVITFDDDRLSCIRFGTADQPKVRPNEAPPDRGVCLAPTREAPGERGQ